MNNILSIWLNISCVEKYIDDVKYTVHELYANASFEYLDRTYNDCIKIKDILTITYNDDGDIISIKKSDVKDITDDFIEKSITAVVDNHIKQIKYINKINSDINDIVCDIQNQTKYYCDKTTNKYI